MPVASKSSRGQGPWFLGDAVACAQNSPHATFGHYPHQILIMIEHVKQRWGKAVCHLLNPIMVPGGNIVDIRGRPEPFEIVLIIRVASHRRRWGRLQSKVCLTVKQFSQP